MFSLIPLPYKIAAVAAFLAVYGGICWFKGDSYGTQKLTEYQAAQMKEAVRIVTKQGEVTTQVVTKYVQVAAKTQATAQTIEKEVVKYETLKLDRTLLSVAAVRLHDSAAANAVPPAASPTDDSPSGVTAAAIVATCTANYATYFKVADELTGLQDWVRQQAAVKGVSPLTPSSD